MSRKLKLLKYSIYLFLLIFLLVFGVIFYFSTTLPDYSSLKDYKPNVMTRVHASNGHLVKEYSREYRIFIPIDDIPNNIKEAFLSAEDKNFYKHYGIDPLGILRASLYNIKNLVVNRRPQGASTITQQVAKNFLLSDELSLSRKIKEALLAFKIEQILSKDRILELYLNQIYLGAGTYGIAAASNRYFEKELSFLSIAEIAYLAALPKAPSRYHPIRNYQLALDRRNWVLNRMFANEYISEEELKKYLDEPIKTFLHKEKNIFSSDYYLEVIRQQIIETFGEENLYSGGLSVRTSLDTEAQFQADTALKEGLLVYDKRYGYRGVIKNDQVDNWLDNLKDIDLPYNFQFAKVISVDNSSAHIETSMNERGEIKLANLTWAREYIRGGYVGPKIVSVKDVLMKNDIIYVSIKDNGDYVLEQIPDINGGIVVMDPHSGRVVALSGGFDFKLSNFNRASQAKRQPGSAFKPFVYISALENGLQPNSLILDAPFVVDQGEILGKWKPENYGKKFYGPSPLRKGIENSRNLMTVRIAQYLGMDKISEIANRVEIMTDMPEVLSMALGAGETTLIDLTSAYASFVNGGKKINPILIDRIQDRRGKNIYLANFGTCLNCSQPFIEDSPVPVVKSGNIQIFDPVNSYQMVSILKGAVDRGTGRRTKIAGFEIGGKTGTTNKNTDAWFIGFTSDLIVGVYAGFDNPRTLGKRETGSSVAVPIFKDFLTSYYKEKKALPFKIPRGVELIQVNMDTGEVSFDASDNKTIYEAFRKSDKLVLDNKTLIGSEGFQIIQIEEELEEEIVIY
tara:strand:+ start:4364 stop:6751 length:2388 start_codon:yes stop_codon:yes gene_type:complete